MNVAAPAQPAFAYIWVVGSFTDGAEVALAERPLNLSEPLSRGGNRRVFSQSGLPARLVVNIQAFVGKSVEFIRQYLNND